MTRLISLLLSAVLAAEPTAEVPEAPPEMKDASAREHFSAGMRAWMADDYAIAQRELAAAYAIEPAPVLLYSLGQLERLQGRCDAARERFLAYLATNPGPEAAADTQANLQRCKPAVVIEPPRVDPPRATPTVADPIAPPRRGPDALGIGLTVTGSIVAVVGLGLFGGAFAEQDRANAQTGLAGFDRRVRRARIEYGTGLALASVGAAVLIAGIVRLAIARRRSLRAGAPARATSHRRFP